MNNAAVILAEFERSGISVAQFALEHNSVFTVDQLERQLGLPVTLTFNPQPSGMSPLSPVVTANVTAPKS